MHIIKHYIFLAYKQVFLQFSLIVILGIVYFKMGLKRAKELGIEKERYIPAIRSAAITSIGPSLSPVIVLLSMIAVVGAPTAWMRLNDVGAARTELSMVAISSDFNEYSNMV